MDARTLRCHRCGKEHKVRDMVMDGGSRMACRPCARLTPARTIRLQETDEFRRTFVCGGCAYSFTSKRERPICGYCGSADVHAKGELSTDRLLKKM